MALPLSDRLERIRKMFESQLRRPLTGEEVKLLELTGPFDDPDEPKISIPAASGE
jgi:hypothetical protein